MNRWQDKAAQYDEAANRNEQASREATVAWSAEVARQKQKQREEEEKQATARLQEQQRVDAEMQPLQEFLRSDACRAALRFLKTAYPSYIHIASAGRNGSQSYDFGDDGFYECNPWSEAPMLRHHNVAPEVVVKAFLREGKQDLLGYILAALDKAVAK